MLASTTHAGNSQHRKWRRGRGDGKAAARAAGNLPLGFYPKPSCAKPDREALGAVPSATDRAAMTAYNLRAKTFNDQVSAFNVCLKTYEEKAQRDIAQMQAISHQAMAQKDTPETPSR